MVYKSLPIVNGILRPIIVHFRPIKGNKSPVIKPPNIAPTANKAPIQLAVSSLNASGRVQLFNSLLIIVAFSLLQLLKKGNAGELHPKPVPKPNAPKLAKKEKNSFKLL